MLLEYKNYRLWKYFYGGFKHKSYVMNLYKFLKIDSQSCFWLKTKLIWHINKNEWSSTQPIIYDGYKKHTWTKKQHWLSRWQPPWLWIWIDTIVGLTDCM